MITQVVSRSEIVQLEEKSRTLLSSSKIATLQISFTLSIPLQRKRNPRTISLFPNVLRAASQKNIHDYCVFTKVFGIVLSKFQLAFYCAVGEGCSYYSIEKLRRRKNNRIGHKQQLRQCDSSLLNFGPCSCDSTEIGKGMFWRKNPEI